MVPELLNRVGAAALIAGLVLVWLVPGLTRAQGLGRLRRAGDVRRTTVFGGLKRTFLLHLPGGVARGTRLPLVIVLHGGGGNSARIARLTGFSALADREQFAVLYPDAINGHWNDGRGVQNFRSQRENVDDVGFIARLIEQLEQQAGIDRTRVCATGMSNGAMMCLRLASELGDRIAAIAPVGGAMAAALPEQCRPSHPMPVFISNGTRDPFVPWEGGGVGLLNKRGKVLSVPQTVEFWVRHNGCRTRPRIERLPDADPNDDITVTRSTYEQGRDGSEVILYRVQGGGHTWPGGAERARHFGPRSRDFDATGEIWKFFSRHRRP
jgi:polyhydroxybutyrate depolymerase